MTSLRITYVVPEFPKLSETFVLRDILGLFDNDIEVDVFSLRRPCGEKSSPKFEFNGNVTYLYEQSIWIVLFAHITLLTRGPRRYLRAVSLLARHIFTNRKNLSLAFGLGYRFFYSAVVGNATHRNSSSGIHAQFAHVAADVVMYAGALAGRPFSFTAHANDLYDQAWLLAEKVQMSEFTVTISDFNREFLAKKGAPTSKIHVIHCGVDFDAFAPKSDFMFTKRMRIGSLGRLVEKKGMDDLIRALAEVVRRGVDAQLDLLGAGPLLDGLKHLALTQGVLERVWFGGAVDHEQALAWLRELDVFVLACKPAASGDVDGIPVVLMEAMATAVPVVTTLVSGVPELVEDGFSGLLVGPGAPDRIADALCRLAASCELRMALGVSGRSTVAKDFDAKVSAQTLARLMRASYCRPVSL
jgi:glycosyltransferase involved in cell wall biosynthesis